MSSKKRVAIKVGSWAQENQWNRAERCRVFLATMGFITLSEAERIRSKVAKDFKANGGK